MQNRNSSLVHFTILICNGVFNQRLYWRPPLVDSDFNSLSTFIYFASIQQLSNFNDTKFIDHGLICLKDNYFALLQSLNYSYYKVHIVSTYIRLSQITQHFPSAHCIYPPTPPATPSSSPMSSVSSFPMTIHTRRHLQDVLAHPPPRTSC